MGIRVGNKISKYPIIQGGMGVGVSMHSLAGHVSKEGGIGILAAVDIGYKEADFATNPLEANLRGIANELKLAREIAGEDKIIGVNVMVALQNYETIVRECVKNNADLIISGAGIPMDLPKYVKDSNTSIAPIVSSARCCKLIVENWIKKYDYIPDLIVIEGPNAGGHLGYKADEILDNTCQTLEEITVDVVKYIKTVNEKYDVEIPVIVAGGIWDKNDIDKFMKLGAAGVQMATRFVATHECDAELEFKEAYVSATKEDVKIIKSPVGMPGRALNNAFIKTVEAGNRVIDKCYKCIKTCKLATTPYCITGALINAVNGDIDRGLIFCGSNVHRVDKIVSVKELINELMDNK